MLCSTSMVSSNNIVDMIKRTQNKALQIISFKDRTEPSDPLCANHKILKLQNIITLNNCLFIYDQLCDNLPNTFSNYFKLLKNQHRHNTRGSNHFTLNVPRVNTETYGSNSIKIKAIKDWNKTTKKINFTLICLSNEGNMLDLSKHLSRHLTTYPILTSSVKQ